MRKLLARLIAAVRGNPALFAGAAQVILGLAVSAGLTVAPGTAAIIQCAGAVVSAAAVAVLARPVAPAAYAGLVTALGSLLIAAGIPHVTGSLVSSASALVAGVVAFILHSHVSPKQPRSSARPAWAQSP